MFKNLFQKPLVIEPTFYENGSEILGVFPIRDSDDKILLPKYPEQLYQVDGKQVTEFRILAIISDEESVIADLPFREGLGQLSSKVAKETDSQIILNPISRSELHQLFVG
ncbi:hypothetical protein [Streptococcus himalayensis]|uniref:Uncharacterized protein n=1 Tax=Streptococcus himalayensis TaxID=1888195 RepID=A0A917A515_9STRE|nr:hypothetical protein [Streptococcus himalayensis]GGE27202.1 hypothetical protein GCM10011510_05460 [Streptococcus himalayensis]